MPCFAKISSTEDASEPILTDRDCALTLSYVCDQTVVTDMEVKLYQIASVSADFQYTLTSSFMPCGLELNGIHSAGEWNVIRSTLEARIIADAIEVSAKANTDATGQVSFDSLQPGMYFAMADIVAQGENNCVFETVLVALPGLFADGTWQYEMTVIPKSEKLPPVQEDEQTEMKVLKLWKGDEGNNRRPKNVEIELFKDGKSYQKVVLSQENNWSYSWPVKQDGAKWTVVERNIASGYTMTVEQRENTFVLTNTLPSQGPDGPEDPPKTGDTVNVMFYVVWMVISGSVLLILGLTGKIKADEKSK
jgi:hypothetical protein